MANPTLTVTAYGNVDALHGIFNAVAMVMNADSFGSMVNIAIVLGFLTVGVLAVVPQNLHKGWTWFLSVAVLSGILLTPKATVSIEDRLGLQPPAVVANVPWLLAVMASVKSAIGSSLTELFETAFQTIPNGDRALPSELSYLEHGVMFGNRLIRGSREADFSALYAQGDTLNYLRNCIFPSAGREAVPGTFEKSTNLLESIGDPNPALFTSYHDAANGQSLVTVPCDQAFPKIERGLQTAGGNALQALGTRLMPDLDAVTAKAKVEESLVAIYGKTALADAGSTAQDIMIQNILINATADASALYGASLNDPSILMFASMRSQAVAQMNAGYLVQGRIAEEALPVLRNITEGILIAVFPVICILAIASEGRALLAIGKGYIYTLLWVELWPPMFSVVNYLQTLHAAGNLTAAGSMSNAAGLSLQTATGIYSTAVSDLAVSAWMVTFVPVVAGAVLFGMDRLMAVANAKGGAAAADSAASQVTKGNTTLGAMSFGQQQLAEYRSDASMVTSQGVGGTTTIDLVSGGARYQHAMSSGPVSLSDLSSLASQRSSAASASVEAASSDSKLAESSVQSALSRIDGLARSGSFGQEGGQAWLQARSAAERETSQDALRAAEQLTSRFGTGDALAISKQLQGGIQTPLILEALGLRAGISGIARDASEATRAVEEAKQSIRDKSVGRATESAQQFLSQHSFRSGRSSDVRAVEDVRAQLDHASTYRESSSRQLSQAGRYQEDARLLQALQRSWNFNNANALYAHFAREGLNPNNPNVTASQWQDSTLRFLRSGEIALDDKGLPTFMPQLGQGPNFVLGHQELSPDGLRAWHGGEMPGAGASGVERAADDRAGQVRSAQAAAGVTPRQGVGTDVVSAVGQGQASAGLANAAARDTAQGQIAGAQRTSDAAFANAPGQHGSVERAVSNLGHDKQVSPAAVVVLTRPRPGADELAKQTEQMRQWPSIPDRPPSETGLNRRGREKNNQ